MSNTLSYYFTPFDTTIKLPSYMPEEEFLVNNLVEQDYTTAIIGIPDKNGSANEVRKQLYRLNGKFPVCKIADLGNIKKGKSDKAMLIALQDVISSLSEKGINCIVIGGEQYLTNALCKGLSESYSSLSLCVIDSKIDVGDMSESVCSHSFLATLVNQNYIYELDIIGVQNYYYSQNQLTYINNNKGYIKRLSEIKKDLFKLEPIIRNADVISIDMSVVRLADAPAAIQPCPNGLFGEDLCQLSRFAGYSDKSKIFFISEWDTVLDAQHHTSLLVAEAIWHYIEGLANRTDENPTEENPIYQKLLVQSEISNEAIAFYHNTHTDKWWIQIPQQHSLQILPCHISDYQSIVNNEIPDIWLRYVYK